jgi:hypothetical protein
MKLYDLDKLTRDTKQDNLYNIFDPTFKMNRGYKLTQYVVSPEQEMRIDLISNSIYGNSDYCDFILDINDIDNPLNIMDGDILIYTEFAAIDEYRIKTVDNNNARARLLNANKTSRKDNARKQYVEDNYSLPPTFLETPAASVRIESNQIVIG